MKDSYTSFCVFSIIKILQIIIFLLLWQCGQIIARTCKRFNKMFSDFPERAKRKFVRNKIWNRIGNHQNQRLQIKKISLMFYHICTQIQNLLKNTICTNSNSNLRKFKLYNFMDYNTKVRFGFVLFPFKRNRLPCNVTW